MAGVPDTELGLGLGVHWYIRAKRKRLKSGEERVYLYLVKVTCANGFCDEDWIANVEEIERIIKEYKKNNARPYTRRGVEVRSPQVAPRAGFEPARGLPHRLSRPAP